MARIFVVSLADSPLRHGRIAGRVRSVPDGAEIVVRDSDELLEFLQRNAVDDAPAAAATPRSSGSRRSE